MQAAANRDHRAGMIIASSRRNKRQRGRLVEKIPAHIQSLHATAQEDFSAQVATLIAELEVDVRIAAYSAQHRLFGNGNVFAQGNEHQVRLESDNGGVSAFGIVHEDQLHLQAAQHDVPIHRDLRAGRVVAEGFFDVTINMQRHVEVNADSLVRAGGGQAKAKQGGQGKDPADGFDYDFFHEVVWNYYGFCCPAERACSNGAEGDKQAVQPARLLLRGVWFHPRFFRSIGDNLIPKTGDAFNQQKTRF